MSTVHCMSYTYSRISCVLRNIQCTYYLHVSVDLPFSSKPYAGFFSCFSLLKISFQFDHPKRFCVYFRSIGRQLLHVKNTKILLRVHLMHLIVHALLLALLHKNRTWPKVDPRYSSNIILGSRTFNQRVLGFRMSYRRSCLITTHCDT